MSDLEVEADHLSTATWVRSPVAACQKLEDTAVTLFLMLTCYKCLEPLS